MRITNDPFVHHPGLRGKIVDPETSRFRTFDADELLRQRPELEWIRPFLNTTAQREENRVEVLKDHREDDLWVFAYGSLMWDPAFLFSDVRRAHVPNYERRFILKDMLGGRGTPENPGLMAALDKGEGCNGLAFRIPKEIIEHETEILWRREFFGPTYFPTLVETRLGDETISALTFVANYEARQIEANITREEQLNCLRNGEGWLGTSLEYLENVVSQFEALGIEDEACSELLAEAKG